MVWFSMLCSYSAAQVLVVDVCVQCHRSLRREVQYQNTKLTTRTSSHLCCKTQFSTRLGRALSLIRQGEGQEGANKGRLAKSIPLSLQLYFDSRLLDGLHEGKMAAREQAMR
jgi:hypothetical protein